eukprot:SAG11_NODE_24155_length_377_cov_0.928058_1_plen_37_part_01
MCRRGLTAALATAAAQGFASNASDGAALSIAAGVDQD